MTTTKTITRNTKALDRLAVTPGDPWDPQERRASNAAVSHRRLVVIVSADLLFSSCPLSSFTATQAPRQTVAGSQKDAPLVPTAGRSRLALRPETDGKNRSLLGLA